MKKKDGSAPGFSDASNRDMTVVREQFYGAKKGKKTKKVYRLNDDGIAVLNLDIAENESEFNLNVRTINHIFSLKLIL